MLSGRHKWQLGAVPLKERPIIDSWENWKSEIIAEAQECERMTNEGIQQL